MTDLRAEEIREALGRYDADLFKLSFQNVDTIVAAARAYLASLEQEPDIEAALEVLRTARPEWTEYVGDPFVVENMLDAAGFRSQPKGDNK